MLAVIAMLMGGVAVGAAPAQARVVGTCNGSVLETALRVKGTFVYESGYSGTKTNPGAGSKTVVKRGATLSSDLGTTTAYLLTCKDKSGKWGVLNNSQKIVTNFKQVSFGDNGTVNVKTSSHHGGYAMVIRQINDGDLRVEGVKCSKGTITLKGGLQAVGKLPIRNYYVKLGVWAAGVTLKGGSRTASKCVQVGSSTAKLGYTVSSAGKPTLKTGTQSREIVQKIAADRRMCSADGTGRGIDKCWSYQIYRVEMKRG